MLLSKTTSLDTNFTPFTIYGVVFVLMLPTLRSCGGSYNTNSFQLFAFLGDIIIMHILSTRHLSYWNFAINTAPVTTATATCTYRGRYRDFNPNITRRAYDKTFCRSC